MRIYLDNAATTPLSRTVFQAMEPYFFENFGNPSSAHLIGREARAAIAHSRTIIADILNTNPEHIVFTSGGTEADNTAILSAIRSKGIKLAITTPFEHHAVLNTLKALERNKEIRLVFLKHDEKGNLSISHLEQLLAANEKAFVSVMHGNNEIGNLNPIDDIANVCKEYGAVFHSDTVQTMGLYTYDTQKLDVDFLVGSAHKFHGPKGIGFLYKKSADLLIPFINGGAQECGQRSGTENVAGIVGLAKAFELAHINRTVNNFHISNLKERMIYKLRTKIPGIKFNGNCADKDISLATILSVSVPENEHSPLVYLDQHRICASGGSACNSRSGKASHVLSALGLEADRTTVRFSFSHYNTAEEIDYTTDKFASLFPKEIVNEIATIWS